MKKMTLLRAGLAALAVVGAAGVHAEDVGATTCFKITTPDKPKLWNRLVVQTAGSEIVGGTITKHVCTGSYKVTGGSLTESNLEMNTEPGRVSPNCSHKINYSAVKTGPHTYTGTYYATDDVPPVYFPFVAKLHACW